MSDFPIVVVGTGFSGIAMGVMLKKAGIDSFTILEKAGDIGGTWRDNTYPGAACDVPSHLYCFSFEPKPDWSRFFSPQQEIHEYLRHCVNKYDLARHIQFRSRVTGAEFDAASGTWTVRVEGREPLTARAVVLGNGALHAPSYPEIPGREEFEGKIFHSAQWDHGLDLAGKTVAVIGTGASAIQVVPAIAERTAHLDVYQRTAPWVLPRRNDPYDADRQQVFATQPDVAAGHRHELYEMFERTTAFVAGDPSVEVITAIARDHLETSVADPDLRARLTPGQPFGCQRTLVSSDYFGAVQRAEVDLVTTPIDRITPGAVRTVDGVERPVDTIVLCTGFRAGDYLCGIDVVGRSGTTLHDRWAGRPQAYLGLAVPDFPNFFMLYGPNTNQGGNSILLILEAQSQFVAAALEAMGRVEAATVEVTTEAMARYAAELERDLATTVWTNGCRSYFHNASGDIVTQLPHTSGWYRDATASIDEADFTFGRGAGQV